jgi:hypothetical protein
MESRNRNAWIIAAAALAIACCCTLAILVAVAAGWFVSASPRLNGLTGFQRERLERAASRSPCPPT